MNSLKLRVISERKDAHFKRYKTESTFKNSAYVPVTGPEMDFTSRRSAAHPAAVCRAPRAPSGPLCTFPALLFSQVPRRTRRLLPRLIISTRAAQIQLGPSFHSVRSARQPKSFFGGCSNLQPGVNIFCRKPSSLRLPDKLTEAIDNSFDSKLQLSVAQRVLLAGVCCDKHPHCSSPDRDFCRPR